MFGIWMKQKINSIFLLKWFVSMKFKIVETNRIPNGIESTVEFVPNLLQRIFGMRKMTKKYYSSIGVIWYEIPRFDLVPLDSKLFNELSKETIEQINAFNRNSAIHMYDQSVETAVKNIKLLD